MVNRMDDGVLKQDKERLQINLGVSSGQVTATLRQIVGRTIGVLVAVVGAFSCIVSLTVAAQERIANEVLQRPNFSGRLQGANQSAGPIRISMSGVDSGYISEAELDSSGGFSFTNVPRGEYLLIATQSQEILGVRTLWLPLNEAPFTFQVGRKGFTFRSDVEWGWRGWCVRSKCVVPRR
jgi:hypothetical protein